MKYGYHISSHKIRIKKKILILISVYEEFLVYVFMIQANFNIVVKSSSRLSCSKAEKI